MTRSGLIYSVEVWSGDRLELIELVRTVSTFVRFNGGLKEVSGIWGEYEWKGSVDELKSTDEGKGRFKMMLKFLAPRIG